ncbi:MAG TPA: hypothetical protein VFD32_17870 [Dehalococcoidia bacterium]|nr:hypothetical protein [Dehalococcoidia bacterium]
MNGQTQALDPQALLPIHQQTRLADLLAVTATIVYKAGCPVLIGSLLRDGGTGLWHLTALLDAEGDVVPPEELGIPQQPFAFALPDAAGGRPLGAVLDAAWQPVPGRTHEGVDQALTVCVPIGEGATPTGALLMLLAEPALVQIAYGILRHAGIAAGHLLGRQERPQSSAILDPRALAGRAEDELARGKRYERPLAIVVCQFNEAETALRAGERIARGLRRWDAIGRVEDAPDCVVIVLPETTREGALGLVDRLTEQLTCAMGAATNQDGSAFAELVSIARARARQPMGMIGGAVPVVGNEAMWVRGAPAGSGPATVRCPACGMIYRWSVPAADERPPDDAALETLREVLLRTCPSHPAIVLAPPRNEGGKRGLFGRLRR